MINRHRAFAILLLFLHNSTFTMEKLDKKRQQFACTRDNVLKLIRHIEKQEKQSDAIIPAFRTAHLTLETVLEFIDIKNEGDTLSNDRKQRTSARIDGLQKAINVINQHQSRLITVEKNYINQLQQSLKSWEPIKEEQKSNVTCSTQTRTIKQSKISVRLTNRKLRKNACFEELQAKYIQYTDSYDAHDRVEDIKQLYGDIANRNVNVRKKAYDKINVLLTEYAHDLKLSNKTLKIVNWTFSSLLAVNLFSSFYWYVYRNDFFWDDENLSTALKILLTGSQAGGGLFSTILYKQGTQLKFTQSLLSDEQELLRLMKSYLEQNKTV